MIYIRHLRSYMYLRLQRKIQCWIAGVKMATGINSCRILAGPQKMIGSCLKLRSPLYTLKKLLSILHGCSYLHDVQNVCGRRKPIMTKFYITCKFPFYSYAFYSQYFFLICLRTAPIIYMSEVKKFNIFLAANLRVQVSFRKRRKEGGDSTGGRLDMTLIFYDYDLRRCNDEYSRLFHVKLQLSRCFTHINQT